MKKISILALSLIPTVAFANDDINNLDVYLRADAGLTYSDLNVGDYDLGGFQGMFNFAFGGQYNRWRAELAYQERATVSELFSSLLTQTMATMEQHAFIVNGYYDIWSSKYFAWYFGGGAGLNSYEQVITYQDTGLEVTTDGYSSIFGLYTGLSINFEHIGIDLGVDYYYTYKPSQNNIVPKVGLRVTF